MLTKELVSQVEAAAFSYQDPFVQRMAGLVSQERTQRTMDNVSVLKAAKQQVEQRYYPEGIADHVLRTATVWMAQAPYKALTLERAVGLIMTAQEQADKEIGELMGSSYAVPGLTITREPNQGTRESGGFLIGDQVAFGRWTGTVLSVGDKLTVEFQKDDKVVQVVLDKQLVRRVS